MHHERGRAPARDALIRTLEPAERREVDEHLARCAECRAVVRPLRDAHVALEEWGSEEPEAIPPLEDRTREAAPTARSPRPWAVAAVVALLCFAGGVAVGATAFGSPGGAGASSEPGTYALFFEEPSESWPRVTDPAAFAAWADRLSEAEAFEGGLRLTEEEGVWVPPAGPAVAGGDAPARSVNLSGAFFVLASSDEDAVTIAREGPHLAHGGVLVRRVAFQAGAGPDWREVR